MASTSLNAKISTTGAAKAQRELKGVSTQAKKTESNVINMGTSFKSASKNAAASAAAITGPMGGIASRIGAVTTVLTSGTAAATAFGLAITAMGFAIAEGITELDSINVELAKTEAILTATGNASGKTSQQLLDQARALGMTTLASTQGIQQAQSKLLTFDKIHGRVFDDAIELTQDLATVFGGDASSQATQLGKALQDPVKGLTALNRVGVSFTKQQEDQVKAMVKSGETMAAQTVIINALKKQVGGAGESVAKDSLAGKLDTAGQSWSEISAKFAEQSGSWDIANKLVDGLVGRLGQLNDALDPKTASDYFDEALEMVFVIGKLEQKMEGLSTGSRRYVKILQEMSAREKERAELLSKAGEVALSEQAEMRAASLAHEASQIKIKEDAIQTQADIDREALEKKIQADLDFYDARQAYAEKANKELAEANKQSYLDDQEFYGNVLQLKLDDDKRVARLKERNQEEQIEGLSDLTGNLKMILSEQSGAYKAAALLDVGVSTYAAAQKAFEGFQSLPQPYGMIAGSAAAGVAIGVGAKNASAIMSSRYQGGQLSSGQTSSLVEQGDLEIITPATSSRVRTKQQMEQIMGGSGGTSNVSLTVIDQSGGSKEYSQEQKSDGEIILLIKDTMVTEQANANSRFSKQQSASTNITRKR